MNAPKRHFAFRTFGSYRTAADADTELRDYWSSGTPEERMETLEALRVRVWGEEDVAAPMVRGYGWRNESPANAIPRTSYISEPCPDTF